jgi:dTDP-4-dehydrorhamnose reductase
MPSTPSSSDGTVIIGAGGMLGRELARAVMRGGRPVSAFASRGELDIADLGTVNAMFDRLHPSVVLNAAAYADVDRAETEEPLAAAVNHRGVANLASVCRRHGSLLMHVSTDYIFDGRGRSPYRTDAPAAPLNAYGRTKLAGERAIIESGCRHLIVRTSRLFAPHGRNFVRTILELASARPTLAVVNDQRSLPTYVPDLAGMILRLLDGGVEGVMHAANTGACSWFDLASEAASLVGLRCRIEPCTTAAMPRPAPRPAYSVLDLGETINRIGQPRPWNEALADCIRALQSAGPVEPVSEPAAWADCASASANTRS